MIATLGNFATKLLTANPTGITKVRGTPQEHLIGGRHLYLLPLFHPAAGLRTPRVAEQLREDFKQIPDLLAQPLPEPVAGSPQPPFRHGAGAGARPDGPVRRLTERTDSAAETEAVGERLAAELEPGDVVLVSGELGAGKTTLIRGACRALGVSEPVTSPTFTIGHTYSGRLPVSHLDLYRLADLGQEDPALLDDYLTPEAVAFIEWPGAAEPWLERVTRRVDIRHAGGDQREIEIY